VRIVNKIIDLLAVPLCIHSQTCIKRSYLGRWKSGLIRQVTFLKRFNLY